MNQLEQALQIALNAHLGQTDKADAPYVLHPIRVALSLRDERAQIAALLHDVVEDSAVTGDELRQAGFDEEIVEAVELLTKTKGEPDGPDSDYLRRIAANPIARAVKLADLRDNMDLSRLRSVDEKDLPRLKKYVASYSYLTDPE